MSDCTQINEWTPGDPCCGGCAIRTIDFTQPGWESVIASGDTITQQVDGVTIEPGVTIEINVAVAASNAPFEFAISAETAAATNVLKLRIEILEDNVLAETIYVEDMTPAELAQANDPYGRRVRMDSTAEVFWDTKTSAYADPAAILINKLGVVVAADQYWAGDWVKSGLSADTNSADFVVIGDDAGWFPSTDTSGPILMTGSAGMDAIVSSPRSAGSTVKFTLTNDSDVALLISEIAIAKLNTPEQDASGRETCIVQPISCEATADRMRMRWTDVRITMPDSTIFSMMMGNRQCGSGGTRLPLTYDNFDQNTLWFYPPEDNPDAWPDPIPYEFDAIQYGPMDATGTVQATENPDELLLSVSAHVQMLTSMLVRGYNWESDGPVKQSSGYDAWTVRLTLEYEQVIPKPAKWATPADATLGSTDLVSFKTTQPSSSPFDPDRIEYAITSLHHGTVTGTKTGEPTLRWQPGVTWPVHPFQFPPMGKKIEGTMVAVDQTFVDAISIVFGQNTSA